MNFTLDCGAPGFTADITQYYYGATAADLILRKYNATTHTYTTVTGATVAQATLAGQSAAQATYQITDGQALDQDATANGIIVDPAGLAQAIGAPNTGLGHIIQ